MKFELGPYNWGLGDDELLADLRAVAEKLNKDHVTKDEYDRLGRLSSSTLQNRFGSWSRAHELAGLRKIRHYDATLEDCINDLKLVASQLGKSMITTRDYRQHGKFSIPLIAARCGSFRDALLRAGLSVSPFSHETITDEQLFENLERLWETLGRQPSKKDYCKPLSSYSYPPYIRRFGSYRKALEAFVASFANGPTAEQNQAAQELPIAHNHDQAQLRHKTSRNVSWRLRFIVMRRDNFRCRICGASPALKPGTILVVDHITPWDAFGETVLENLQTLCEQCNGGKSNLPLSER